MANPRTQRQPTFFWQGLLILLPVVVLAAIGGASLRQDKILAETDARERAQVIADSFVLKIWNELNANNSDQFGQCVFQVDGAGRLEFPPTNSLVPTPHPLDPAELTTEQARLWATLQAADTGTLNEEARERAFQEFRDSNPPENFAGVAGYRQGLRLMQQGKLSEAIEAFGLVVDDYPNAVGESGLPLAPLAQLKLMEILPQPQGPSYRVRHRVGNVPVNRLQPDGTDTNLFLVSLKHFVLLDVLCSNLVYQPTPMSPLLLAHIQNNMRLPEELFPQTHHTGKLQKEEGGETTNGVRIRQPWSAAQLADALEFRKWQRLWQDHEMARQLYAVARGYWFGRTNPAPSAFPLASIISLGENQSSLPISFPRSFWFTTPHLLFAPQVPGRATFAEHPVYPSYVVVKTAGSRSSSNAISPGPRWVPGGVLDRNWLAIAVGDDKTNHRYVCRGESDLGRRITELAAGEKHLPDYFGISVEVAGKKISAGAPDLHMWTFHYRGGSKGGGGEVRELLNALATNPLASAVQSERLLKVNVYLTGPDKLYQWQRARTFWFGLLVAASAVAALFGLLTAWHVFHQQRQLNEMKSNFVSSVSHELRAPIASMRLMAENLEGGKIPEAPKQKEYFGFIVQECRRLSSLIENVLDFSRIEQGRKQYELEPTDVLALVQTTVRLMEPYAAEKGANLVLGTSNIQHPTSNIELEMDGRAIQQALVNLIDNAIKHSPKGETVTVGIEVRSPESRVQSPAIAAESVEDEGRERGRGRTDTTLNLFVSDHGPGIPAAEREKIFERFYRRGSELRRETQGVGIGLSLVKHIVEAHGGRVRVESEVGRGSRFTIELPIKNETSNIEH